MKKMKKLASMFLAMLMILSMLPMTAFASQNSECKITINLNETDGAKHLYLAYQIFKGDLSTKENQLSNIQWGDSITDGNALIEDLQANEAFGGKDSANWFYGKTTAAQVAEVLGDETKFTSSDENGVTKADDFATVVSKYLKENAFAQSAEVTYSDSTKTAEITVNAAGYYMVMDSNVTPTVDADGNIVADGAKTRYLLKVVGPSEMTIKSTVPSGTKDTYYFGAEAKENGYKAAANTAAYGDHVGFEINSRVPNYVGYENYYFIMNDTMGQGLAFDGAESVTVTVGEDELVQGQDYYVYTGSTVAPFSFRLAFNPELFISKKYAVDTKIVAKYSATVTEDAPIGSTGIPNTWELQYSKGPYEDYGEGTTPNTTPGLPAKEKEDLLGKTPEDMTLTFVAGLDLTKYAEKLNGELLNGVEFTLSGVSKQVKVTKGEYFTESETGNYYKLLNGQYTTVAPISTEKVYLPIGVGTNSTTEGFIYKDGTYIVPDDKDDYIGQKIYEEFEPGNLAKNYANVEVKYELRESVSEEVVEIPVNIKAVTVDGKISFKGLGEGSYTLSETGVPDGYNKIEDITFNIVCKLPTEITDNATCEWSATEVKGGSAIEGDSSITITPDTNGVLGTSIINKSGSLLPSTGGIGTTIFYIVGGVLIVGAGILLVAKKRMSAK